MWAYVALTVVILAVAAIAFMKRRETFTWKKFPANMTEQITTLEDTNPVGTAPSASFEGNTYVPGYYKIQTTFPMLTKWKPRQFDIHA